jgi:hypothetical protein
MPKCDHNYETKDTEKHHCRGRSATGDDCRLYRKSECTFRRRRRLRNGVVIVFLNQFMNHHPHSSFPYFVYLSDSTNGTFVNGRKIGKGNFQSIRAGDEISLSARKGSNDCT